MEGGLNRLFVADSEASVNKSSENKGFFAERN